VTQRNLAGHTPSVAAERRAAEAGLDLDLLRREDPERYMMLNAEEAIRADGELAGPVAQTLSILFPRHEIFRLDAGPTAHFRVFPEPADGDLERLEDAAARLVTATSVPNAMFRVVTDLRGERREVLVAVPPDRWRGDARVVGPFATQAQAEAWADRRVERPLLGDPFPQDGAWFVDVFPGDEEMVRASGRA
jgi:hypothetical protein